MQGTEPLVLFKDSKCSYQLSHLSSPGIPILKTAMTVSCQYCYLIIHRHACVKHTQQNTLSFRALRTDCRPHNIWLGHSFNFGKFQGFHQMQVTQQEPISVFIASALKETDWFALEVENISYYTIKFFWNKLNVHFNSSEHFFMKDVTCVTIALTWSIQSPNSRHTPSVRSILGTFCTSSPSLQHTHRLYLPFAFLCGEI